MKRILRSLQPWHQDKVHKERVRVDTNNIQKDDKLIIPEPEELTSKPVETEVVNFLELENTLEKPSLDRSSLKKNESMDFVQIFVEPSLPPKVWIQK